LWHVGCSLMFDTSTRATRKRSSTRTAGWGHAKPAAPPGLKPHGRRRAHPVIAALRTGTPPVYDGPGGPVASSW